MLQLIYSLQRRVGVGSELGDVRARAVVHGEHRGRGREVAIIPHLFPFTSTAGLALSAESGSSAATQSVGGG